MVDKRPLGGIRIQVTLAPATLLCSTGLVVNQNGTAGNVTQCPLYSIQLGPVMKGYVIWKQLLVAIVLFGLITKHHNPAHALSGNLLRDHRYGDLAIHGLAAGHGHRVVEQDLVGNVDAGRHRLANSHGSGMKIRALTQVLEYMGVADVPALAEPINPF